MRKACGESHMKSILAVGELCNLTNIYRASLVAMMAGSDFIKTSTGMIFFRYITKENYIVNLFRERDCECNTAHWSGHVPRHSSL
jgi:deoxyribose-phosphate aldolase